jgi:hypothetical protein
LSASPARIAPIVVRVREAHGTQGQFAQRPEPLPELTVFGMMLGSGKEIVHFMRATRSVSSAFYASDADGKLAVGKRAPASMAAVEDQILSVPLYFGQSFHELGMDIKPLALEFFRRTSARRFSVDIHLIRRSPVGTGTT